MASNNRINFYSEEWEAIREELDEMVTSELRVLENATTEKDADKARGALKAVRRLLDLPNRHKKQQQL
jgi:hypothetical protein